MVQVYKGQQGLHDFCLLSTVVLFKSNLELSKSSPPFGKVLSEYTVTKSFLIYIHVTIRKKEFFPKERRL